MHVRRSSMSANASTIAWTVWAVGFVVMLSVMCFWIGYAGSYSEDLQKYLGGDESQMRYLACEEPSVLVRPTPVGFSSRQ